MCGISGILNADPRSATEWLQRSLRAQSHRGPDAWGDWSDDLCALGHRRLSIIDLSEAGRQPLSNEDGTVWITFNGEVYNFQALREELEGLGHQFRTRTDTEAIVHAYEQWGPECVQRLRGMFAFAIWDQNARRLFLARDRAGKKPLFYTEQAGSFRFASELQGLLADPGLPREPDPLALDLYLSLGYIPAPLTGFKGIRKLPPAHYLLLDLSGPSTFTRQPSTTRYWRVDYEPKLRLAEAEAAEALREKLTEAVRLRMVSDVPLGAFLSGGIDSSIVVGLMAGLSERPVKTFSIGFEEAAYNELEHARRVADRWSTDHHEHIVQADALAILPTLVRHYGEPYADSSAVPTFYVSQITRQRVTVALNGDGGDESFAGYDRYRANREAERIRRLPGSRLAAEALSRVLPDSLDFRNPARRLRRFLQVAHQPMAERYAKWVGFFTPDDKGRLLTPEFQRSARSSASLPHFHTSSGGWIEALLAESGSSSPVDQAMAVDVQSYLPYDLLVKVDITSMANSLEARSPFLDHEVMEFAAQLPVNLKLGKLGAKHLLKQAFPDLLPPENVNRAKMGFGVPVGEWFRGPLRELLEDSLLSGRHRDRGLLRAGEVERLVRDHVERRADQSFPLWNLLMLELWHQEMVDRVPEPLTV